MTQMFWNIPNAIGVLWILSVELLFYIIITGLAVCRWHQTPAALIVAFIAACVAAIGLGYIRSTGGSSTEIMMPIGLAATFLGSILQNFGQQRRRYSAALIGMHLTTILCAGWFDITLMYVTLSACCGVVLFLAFLAFPNIPKPLPWLGRISYSTYLLHLSAMVLVQTYLASIISFIYGSPGTLTIGEVTKMFYVLCMALTIPISAASFYLIERPAQWVGKRIPQYLGLP